VTTRITLLAALPAIFAGSAPGAAKLAVESLVTQAGTIFVVEIEDAKPPEPAEPPQTGYLLPVRARVVRVLKDPDSVFGASDSFAAGLNQIPNGWAVASIWDGEQVGPGQQYLLFARRGRGAWTRFSLPLTSNSYPANPTRWPMRS